MKLWKEDLLENIFKFTEGILLSSVFLRDMAYFDNLRGEQEPLTLRSKALKWPKECRTLSEL